VKFSISNPLMKVVKEAVTSGDVENLRERLNGNDE
jgi:hypothetical protein